MNRQQETIPSLDIFHRVININTAQVDGLSRALIGDEAAYDSLRARTVKGILKPARLIRVETIVHPELLNLYEEAGIRGITEEHIDELIEYLGGILPTYNTVAPTEKLYDTPTLPAKVVPLERGKGLELSIAGSQEMMQERALAKAAILNFYRLKGRHADAWLEDEQVTRAILACSDGPRSNDMLRQLKVKLDKNPGLLPASTDIGGIVILPYPHRNPHRQTQD